ncbi:MAG: formylmethanofuran dehydrogenase subunit B [Isosphaeraceae bacterium]
MACGCLCDDIALSIVGGRILEARCACELGRAWFLRDHDQGDRPAALIDGRAVPTSEALDRAAAVLALARAPVILGLDATTIETQGVAVALADWLGAVIDPTHSQGAIPRLRAVQRVGQVSATLGEVKNRADLVLFWGVDPVVTHPRHFERYSVEPVGRFVPEGRAGRSVLVADASPTATAERADVFLQVQPDAQFETLHALRALIRQVPLDPRRAETSTGVLWEQLRDWADRLTKARYGAFFFGDGLGKARGGSANVEAALLLVRDLNTTQRFVALTLGGPGNPSGAESVLTWQAGFPTGVDLSLGVPRPLPADLTALDLLARGEADAALIVADDPTPYLSPAARDHLGRIPTIVIAPDATSRTAHVALASATYGIHAPGTVARSDGVLLPLRPPLATDLPTDRQLLIKILVRLNPRIERKETNVNT